MPDNSILYTAVYDDVNDALADLDAVKQLHEDQLVGDYDAAVIDHEDGKPHVVKRADHPSYRVIPEAFGSGKLPRKELHEAAEELTDEQAALIVIGEPTVAAGLEQAVTRSTQTFKRSFDSKADQIADELSEAIKQSSETK